jgi:hypothetical protein
MHQMHLYARLQRHVATELRTLGHEAGLRRVNPWSWSVYRSSSSAGAPPSPPLTSASVSDAEATRSWGDEVGKGRAVRSSEAAETALLDRRGGGEEMSHLGAMVRGGGRRWARPASFSGGPWRGLPTSGIDGSRFVHTEAFARGYARLCRSVCYRHSTLAVGPPMEEQELSVYNYNFCQ